MNLSTSAPNILVPRIIWGALLVSQGIYFSILSLALRPLQGESLDPRLWPLLTDPREIALTFGALSAFIASIALPKLLGRAPVRPEPEGTPVTSEESRLVARLLIRLALTEAICLAGFILAYVSRAPNLIFPYFAVSFVIFVRLFPSSWEKIRSDVS